MRGQVSNPDDQDAGCFEDDSSPVHFFERL